MAVIEAATGALFDRLARHKTLGGAPREEHAWLIEHGRLRLFGAGEMIAAKDTPISSMFVLFKGHVTIRVDRGAGPRTVLEWWGGDVHGTLPYSRMGRPPGNSIAEEPTEVLDIPREHFPEMIRACPAITAVLVHVMLDRARVFTSSDLHDEKMLSLGRLAAGLAHELNNPASAASRSAHVLAGAFRDADTASFALGAANLSAAQRDAIQCVRDVCLSAPVGVVRTPLERADREDEIATWLADHGANTAAAVLLAETAVSRDALDTLAATLAGEPLDAALRWIAAGCNMRSLVLEIEGATSRIDQLVGVIKRWTYMDHQGGAEVVHVSDGLRDTVAMLSAKARDKSVSMTFDLDAELPPVRAHGSELNQVWVNLLDNAIYAAPESGSVTISARHELERVVVAIVDDGGGIAPEIMGRIFDPFFTTKPVGQGTGMGLEITQRLVRRNSGEIFVESRPGRTEFRLTFPVAEGEASVAR